MEIGKPLRGLGASARAAAGSAAGGAKGLVRRGVHAGRSGAAASRDWVLTALRTHPGPSAPATEPWDFSVGALVSRHPKVPGALAKPLSLLNGLGAVHLSPEAIGFDGEEIPWSKVIRVRVRNGVTALAEHSVDAEFERLRGLLPPVPGRKWGVNKTAEGLKAAIGGVRERVAREPETAIEVACEIVYRGRLGREKPLRACMYTTAFLALRPDVTTAIVATATAAGVPVAAPEDGLTQREAADRLAALQAQADAAPVPDPDLAPESRPQSEPGPKSEPGEAPPPGPGPGTATDRTHGTGPA